MSETPVEEIMERSKKYVVYPHGMLPYVFIGGKGCILKDPSGKEYVDCGSGTFGPAMIGHCHPRLVEAIKKQSEKLIHPLTICVNVPRVELAEKLAKITPPKLTKSYFASGGGEAVEAAIKGAMRITGKREVVSVYNAYHGSSFALMSLGQPWHRRLYPQMPGFRQIPPAYCYRCFYGKEYPECDLECARALEMKIKFGSYDEVAAFVIEPILGNGGHILPPSKEYFKIIREICNKYNVLLIADEVQTCLGRTGKMWGCEYFEFMPDVMVLGKALGGGIPVSAAIFREDIMPPRLSEGQEFWHAFTNEGNPLQCAAASAVIDVVVEEKLQEKAAKMGLFMTERLKEMEKNYELIGEVRGPGLFIGVEIIKDKKTKEPAPQEANQIILKSLEKGALFGLSNVAGVGNVIKIKPPLIIT